MKLFAVACASLGLASAASVTKKVSYDDWKVYRINVDSNKEKANEVVNKLQLELWKGQPSSSSVVDVMVPPSQVNDFEASTADVETRLMHDNLGLSIADEESFSVYAGTLLPNLQ
jgi:carboxypeptidase A4